MDFIKKINNSKVKTIKVSKNSTSHNINTQQSQNDSLPDICCLCGIYKSKHSKIHHRFCKIREEYRCKICNKFFYEHNHSKTPCFFPYKYII